MSKKFKTINDPVHGVFVIPNGIVYKIIQHRYFQRLRKISQTGLTELVYPGAKHSRFLHAIGCVYLMQNAVSILKQKGVDITKEEEEAVYIAILLHDLGHGPYSHSLEYSFIEGCNHETISLQLMENLNTEFNGELSLAIEIFKGSYYKRFLTQLVSSQLDIDRLDYLKRDSFFTGVVEGSINPERIISMMNVCDNELVIDAKGISSVEKFLLARIYMYNSVYLHKTSYSAEIYLIQVLRRAKELSKEGKELFGTKPFKYFLNYSEKQKLTATGLDYFTELDDTDVMASVKEWRFEDDKILSTLAKAIVERKLPKSSISLKPVSNEEIERNYEKIKNKLGIEDPTYFVQQSKIKIKPYDLNKNPIKFLFKNGNIEEITDVEQGLLKEVLRNEIVKYHFHSL